MVEDICMKCAHRNVCSFYEPGEECGACNQFIDKSRYIELPCKVGDTVWVLNQRLGQVFENTVTGIYIKSESDLKNHVTLRHINKLHAESYRSFTFRQFGRTVFYEKEEAEAALAERMKNEKNP